MKKILTLLTTLLILLVPLVSCKKDAGKDPPGSSEVPGDISVDGGSETEEPPYTLPERDYEWRNFNILIPPGKVWEFEEHAVNTDLLNSLIVQRNTRVEFAYKVSLNYIKKGNDASEYQAVLNAEMTGQNGDYDMCFYPNVYDTSASMIVNSQYFYNLTDMDYIDLSQDWWVQGWNDPCTINGKLYGAVGYGTVQPMSGAVGVFFNKDIYTEVFADNALGIDSNYESLYEFVENGAWTFEKMSTMSEMAKLDVDGNGIMNELDRYGLTADFKGTYLLYSMGSEYVIPDEEEGYVLNFGADHNLDVFEKLYAFLTGGSFRYTDDMFTNNKSFTEGLALFNLNSFDNGNRIKMGATSFDYGILPYPKYDTEQKDYITVNASMSYFSIPTTVDDLEFSQIMMNAFNYYSLEVIRPKFADTVLKYGISQDVKDAKMIDLIFDSLTPDFSYIFRATLDHHDYHIYNMIVQPSTQKYKTYSTFIKGNTDYWQKQLDTILGKTTAGETN